MVALEHVEQQRLVRALASRSSSVVYSARSTDSRASSSSPGCLVRTTSSVHSVGLMRNTSQFGSACSSGVCRNRRVGGSRKRNTTSCAFGREPLARPQQHRARLPTATCRGAAARAANVSVRDVGSTPGSARYPMTRLTFDEPRGVLPAHRVGLGIDAAHRLQHLDLVVADHLRVPQRGRLHRRERHHLDEVVLDHVAQRADAVVVARPAFDTERLGDGDLDLVDVRGAAAPAR